MEIYPGLLRTDWVCSGAQGAFQPDEMEASLMYGNQSRKRNWRNVNAAAGQETLSSLRSGYDARKGQGFFFRALGFDNI